MMICHCKDGAKGDRIKQFLNRDCFTSLAMTIMVFVFFTIFATLVFAELPVSKNAIAFTRLTNGYWQIWSVDPDGNNLVQLTFSLKDKRKPVWKPKEDQILYHTNNNELFLYDLSTQKETQLFSELGKIADACFTPDGKKIVFSHFDAHLKDSSNLWLYDLETKEKTLLTRDPGLQYSPDVSGDGKLLAYIAGKGWGTHEVWLLNLETKEKTRLTNNKVYDLCPEISPDGTQIAWASNLTGNYDIWVMGIDGKNQKKITKPLGMEMCPSWSGDGKRLAIASQRSENLQIWTIDLEGKNWKQLTQGQAEAVEPKWRK